MDKFKLLEEWKIGDSPKKDIEAHINDLFGGQEGHEVGAYPVYMADVLCDQQTRRILWTGGDRIITEDVFDRPNNSDDPDFWAELVTPDMIYHPRTVFVKTDNLKNEVKEYIEDHPQRTGINLQDCLKSPTGKETCTIKRIATRYQESNPSAVSDREKLQLAVDLIITHHIMPLRLNELLEADDFNFNHDISGIQACLEREEGNIHMGEHFIPRFAQ